MEVPILIINALKKILGFCNRKHYAFIIQSDKSYRYVIANDPTAVASKLREAEQIIEQHELSTSFNEENAKRRVARLNRDYRKPQHRKNI